MNSLYTKAVIVLLIIAAIVGLALGVMWMNRQTISDAADRSTAAVTEAFARQRAEDQLAHEREIQALENKIEEARSDARQRVAALDVAQRRANDQLFRRLSTLPDTEVGEAQAAVLEESRNRWPE